MFTEIEILIAGVIIYMMSRKILFLHGYTQASYTGKQNGKK